MTKQGERDYLRKIGAEGIWHSANKPFSDDNCGIYLAEMGAFMSLLPSPPARLLDLGCGTGWTSCFFARRGYDVIGQDISDDMVHHANIRKEKEQLANLSFLVGDYEDTHFENEFDLVVFFDSLHHAIDEEKALLCAFKALKKGGICITSEPGTGHGRSEVSKQAVKDYDVTEKDMPPARIIAAGKKAGFSKFDVYPNSNNLNTVLYRKLDGVKRVNFLKYLSGIYFFRYFFALLLMTVYKKNQGIVILTK